MEILHVADLFVIDCPTTVLLEALTTNKKIIVAAFKDFSRIDPKAVTLLRKRTVLSETKEEFLRNIELALQKEDWNLPEPVDREFMKAYGTHLDDGRSAERTFSHLLRLMQ